MDTNNQVEDVALSSYKAKEEAFKEQVWNVHWLPFDLHVGIEFPIISMWGWCDSVYIILY